MSGSDQTGCIVAEERRRRIEELLRRQAVASLAEIMEVTGASEDAQRGMRIVVAA